MREYCNCQSLPAIATLIGDLVMFPAMALEFPEQIAILQSEHSLDPAVLAGATDGTARVDPAWPTRVIEAMSLLRRHIAKEQDGVFHAAVSILSNEQWNRLGEIRQALKLVSS